MSEEAENSKINLCALISLVCGTLGLSYQFLFVCIFPILCLPALIGNILAIASGHRARKEIEIDPTQVGKDMAFYGLILGYVGLTMNLLIIILTIVFF